jgi:hypothetical protein
MSEETKKKESELDEKDLEQVAGGDSTSPPLFLKDASKGGTFVPNKTIT